MADFICGPGLGGYRCKRGHYLSTMVEHCEQCDQMEKELYYKRRPHKAPKLEEVDPRAWEDPPLVEQTDDELIDFAVKALSSTIL